jgi:3,2-trans-enoyl-CoA isomerase
MIARLLAATAVRRPLVRLARGAARSWSSEAGDASHLIVQRQDAGTASIQLSSAPVNGLSAGLLRELLGVLGDLDADTSVRGIVLGSAMPGVFSAGVHLPELLVGADGSVEHIAEYWGLLQEAWLTLYTTPLATVASISGHCPAGGCILALACDARVMVDGKGTIGLNEAAFGLVPPPWLSRMLIDVTGRRRAEDMIMRGVLLPPDEALAAGIVDAVVPLSSMRHEANSRLAALLQVPDVARRTAKQQLRHEAAEALRMAQSEDLDAVIRLVSTPAVQASIVGYLESLRKKSDEEQ